MNPEQTNTPTAIYLADNDIDTKSYFVKVFMRMWLALWISWVTARFVSVNPQIINLIFSNNIYFYGIAIIELLLIRYISSNIKNMSLWLAGFLFIAYSIINGALLSTVFIIFQLNSIITIFGSTTLLFVVIAIYAYTTNSDLTKLWTLAFMWLLWIIIAWIINMFLWNSALDLAITIIWVIIFVALTAYDIQKLKAINTKWDIWTENEQKEAIIWALQLYIDFINLFLKLLRLFGKRK